MSRIGRLPIAVPASVKISVADGVVTVEGPKGKLSQTINPAITVEVEAGKVVVSRANDEKSVKAAHGLTRQLINNMVVGVTEGYKKDMTIVGVGYKAEMKGKDLILSLGFANDIEYITPENVKITCDGPNKISVQSIDKQLCGQVAAEIRSLKKPEPYKGKGIKYDTEHVRAKSGKSGKK